VIDISHMSSAALLGILGHFCDGWLIADQIVPSCTSNHLQCAAICSDVYYTFIWI